MSATKDTGGPALTVDQLAESAHKRLGAGYYTLGLHRLTPREVADYFHGKPITGIKSKQERSK